MVGTVSRLNSVCPVVTDLFDLVDRLDRAAVLSAAMAYYLN